MKLSFAPQQPMLTPPAPSLTLNQPTPKPAVSSVDSFEKVEASGAKNRAGGMFHLPTEDVEQYIQKYYRLEGVELQESIPILMQDVAQKVFNESKIILPALFHSAQEPKATTEISPENLKVTVAVVTNEGLGNLIGSSGVEGIEETLSQANKITTPIVDTAFFREFSQKMQLPIEQIDETSV